MSKLKKLLGLLLVCHTALAATHTTCPNPVASDSQSWRQRGWFSLTDDTLSTSSKFIEVLISQAAYVNGFRTITCNYQDKEQHKTLHIARLARVQAGTIGPWEKIYRGGVLFNHCVVSIPDCFFYIY